jgi:glycosyltransferase involved in cell wall biosynthesis
MSARLATEIRRRLGPAPEVEAPPLVSIVVLNRDGAAHLRSLLAGLVERTEYRRIELILVDNGSSDDSIDLIHRASAPFPISTLANAHNESFSDACNQGAELASGEIGLSSRGCQ